MKTPSLKYKINSAIGPLAAIILAILALCLGYYELSERFRLLDAGLRTQGVVTGVDIGVKGLRRVEVEFSLDSGEVLTGLDIHKTQWISANEKGDKVSLYYDPDKPKEVLIDRGYWIWSNPFFLLVCGLLLTILTVILLIVSSKAKSRT